MNPENWRNLWAKSEPHHLLWRHLLDAAAVCEALIPCFGGVPGLPDEWVCLLVGLHDIGKADPEFQIKDPVLADDLRARGIPVAPSQAGFRHEARSAEWLFDWLREEIGWKPRAATVVRAAINGHHGNFQAKPKNQHDCEIEWWKTVRGDLTRLLVSALGVEAVVLDCLPDASTAALKLSALTVLSDWIASNSDLYPYSSLQHLEDPAGYFAAARTIAKDRVRALAFESPANTPVAGPLRFRELFGEERFPAIRNPRPLQTRLDELAMAGELPPGLVIIEDRMGEGKSEAALFIVEHWNRLLGRSGAYIALPTAATSNQMHSRYEKFLRLTRGHDAEPRLIHGMAWMVEDDSPQEPGQTFDDGGDGRQDPEIRSWFRNTRRALLAQEGVGTVDQALMAALNVPFGFLRLLGLSRKVLVVDEVHAYDEYMTLILERLLEWCRALQIPVILLSATLSMRQKVRLLTAYGSELPDENRQAYPLITVAPPAGSHRAWRVKIEPRHPEVVRLVPQPGLLNDPVATASLAVDQVQTGGCCCVLMNTVSGAQGVFQHLRRLKDGGELPADTELILFHARFRAEVRKAQEDLVVELFGRDAGTERHRERPQRAILVATQVVEQSLDVDFDVMISQIAPIDLLLQRLGRMHRHEGRSRHSHREAVLHVLLPGHDREFAATAFVYSNREPLLRTYALVENPRSIRCPEDFRILITACYDGGPIPTGILTDDELNAAHAANEAEDCKAEAAAKTHLLARPDPEIARFTDRDASAEGEEGQKLSRLRARTRLGDTTARVLVLHDGKWDSLLVQQACPPSPVLRQLLRHYASVPVWWLNACPERGYAELSEAPTWLRGYHVIRCRNRVWRGTGGRKEPTPMIIRDDEHLGLMLTHEEQADDFDV